MERRTTRGTGRWGRAIAALVVAAAATGAVLYLVGGRDDGGKAGPGVREARREADRRRAVDLAAELRRRALLESLSRIPVLTVEIRGAVYSGVTGSGIPDATVTLASTSARFEAATGSDGRWSARVPAAVYRVSARAAGHVDLARAPAERLPGPLSAAAGEPLLDLAPIVVADSDRSGVDLFLVPGARIRGTVRDGAGDPVAGAVVRGAGFEGLERAVRVAAGTDTAVTREDGAYAIDVPAGPVVVTAGHDDFAGLAREEEGLVFVSPGEEVTLDLVLSEGCVITGTVEGPGGAPREGALERWVGGPPPVDYRPAGRFEGGRFRYATTETGEVRLRAWPWKSAPSPAEEFDCQPGARFDGVVFVVPDTPPDISGVVVDLDGEPVPGAHIDIMPLDPGGLPQQERADGRGEWAVFTQPAGRYVVTAFVPDEGAASERVVVPSRDVRLALSGTGAVQGAARGIGDGSFTLLVDACRLAGEPLPVIGQIFERSPARVVPVRDGRFLVTDLPACRIQATAVAAGRQARATFTVVADETVEADLDFGEADLEP